MKRRLKKLAAFGLAAVMTTGLLAGCGNGQAGSEKTRRRVRASGSSIRARIPRSAGSVVMKAKQRYAFVAPGWNRMPSSAG